MEENVEHVKELCSVCKDYGIGYEIIDEYPKFENQSEFIVNCNRIRVHFLLAFPDWIKSKLLESVDCVGVIYTPTNEHFGIVPLEAMSGIVIFQKRSLLWFGFHLGVLIHKGLVIISSRAICFFAVPSYTHRDLRFNSILVDPLFLFLKLSDLLTLLLFFIPKIL